MSDVPIDFIPVGDKVRVTVRTEGRFGIPNEFTFDLTYRQAGEQADKLTKAANAARFWAP